MTINTMLTGALALTVAAATFSPDTITSSRIPAPDRATAELQLRTINHRYVSAFRTPDVAFMDSLIDQDFVLTETNGALTTRAEHLAAIARSNGSRAVSYDDVRVRLFGSVALLHGTFEALTAGGDIARVRYTDVYRWDGGQWRLISAQNTAIRPGVSKAMLRGDSPLPAPWQGSDPVGDDHAVLQALNGSYVRAFREADAAWYNAHLSPDYLVIGSDGSFRDRAYQVAAFARPVFAEQLQSFPVDKVRIRQFGDVALIHAENDYRTKDGKRGIDRYTDIWLKQGGRWMCVAAHITTLREPA
jgi:ketosteroid isomerase-like protein